MAKKWIVEINTDDHITGVEADNVNVEANGALVAYNKVDNGPWSEDIVVLFAPGIWNVAHQLDAEDRSVALRPVRLATREEHEAQEVQAGRAPRKSRTKEVTLADLKAEVPISK